MTPLWPQEARNTATHHTATVIVTSARETCFFSSSTSFSANRHELAQLNKTKLRNPLLLPCKYSGTYVQDHINTCMMMRCVRSLLKRTMHSPVIYAVLLCPHQRYRIFDCILNEPRNEDGRHMTGSAKSPFDITIRNSYHTRSLDGVHRDDRFFEKIFDCGIHDMYPDNSTLVVRYIRFFFLSPASSQSHRNMRQENGPLSKICFTKSIVIS